MNNHSTQRRQAPQGILADKNHHHAFALISTLLVLTLLTIMVIAFLQSMRTDRLTSRAYLNKFKADTLAQAAQQAAITRILQAVPTGSAAPLGFVTWGYATDSDFRPFYVAISRDILNGDFADTGTTTYWLVSSVSGTDTPNQILQLPAAARANMNADRQIDSANTAYPAGWIYVTDTTTVSGTYGRYAYWVDDESSKLDLSCVGNPHNTVTTATLAAQFTATNLKIAGLADDDIAKLTDRRDYYASTETPDAPATPAWYTPRSIAQTVPALSGSANLNRFTVEHTEWEVNTGLGDFPYNRIPYGEKVGEPKLPLNHAALTGSGSAAATGTISAVEATGSIARFIQDTLPAYYQRKETFVGPRGAVTRIAASIVNYIRPERYPILSPALHSKLTNLPALANTWGLTTADPANWHGIAAVPRVNEILYYFGPASSGSISYDAKPDPGAPDQTYPYKIQVGLTRVIEVWNMNDEPVTVPNLYLHLAAQQYTTIPGGGLNNRLPALDSEDLSLTETPLTLAPNTFHAFTVTRTYTTHANGSSGFNQNNQSQKGTATGFVLFYVEGDTPAIATAGDGSTTIQSMNGTPRILDAFYPCNLGGSYAGGKSGCSPGYSTSGNTSDTRLSLGRFLGSWATTASARHTPGAANNTNSGGSSYYQNMNTWFDRPATAAAPGAASDLISTIPVSAPAHIAHAPMRNIVELGNIFDPALDTATGDSTPGTPRPRGGKTLVIGQPDPFVTPNTYRNYLATADTALLEIFDAAPTTLHYRLNLNVPRPGTLTDSGTDRLNPLRTITSHLRLANNGNLQYSPPTVARPAIADNPVVPHLAARLTTPNASDARPVRNYADLTLLGIPPAQLTLSGTLPADASIWGRQLANDSLYQTTPALKNVPLATKVQGNGTVTQSTARLDGSDRLREEAFGRLAPFVTFRSYRYRIYAQGQALHPRTGKVLARGTAGSLLELIPVGTGTNLKYNIKVTPLP
jgi:hypothetical protein